MATLHVRDVPDELYGLLREQAAANGRSIGAETIQLLGQRFTGHRDAWPRDAPDPMLNRPLFDPGRRRSMNVGWLERFTPGARAVVDRAQQLARSRGHPEVGTEHLLLGILCADGSASVASALERSGLTREHLESEIERLRGRGLSRGAGQPPLAPDAKQALELASREALRLNDDRITSDHIMLGIIDRREGAGASIVGAVEPDVAKLRARVLRERHREMRSNPPRGPLLVIELNGDAAAWETQLNEAAGRGYELVAIVDRRAILKLA